MEPDIAAIIEQGKKLEAERTPGEWSAVSDLPMFSVAAGRDYRVVPSQNQNNERTYGKGIFGGTTLPNADFISWCANHVGLLLSALERIAALEERWKQQMMLLAREPDPVKADSSKPHNHSVLYAWTQLQDCRRDIRAALSPTAEERKSKL